MKNTPAQENLENAVHIAAEIAEKFNQDSMSPQMQKLLVQLLGLANQVGEIPEVKAMVKKLPSPPSQSNNSDKNIDKHNQENTSLKDFKLRMEQGLTPKGFTVKVK